jgi:hypothetical protein
MLRSSIDEDLHLYNAMFKVLWLKNSEPKLMLGESWLQLFDVVKKPLRNPQKKLSNSCAETLEHKI